MFVAENTTINVSKFLPVSSSIVRLVGIRLLVMHQKWISEIEEIISDKKLVLWWLVVDGNFVFLRQYLIFGRGSGTIYQKIYLSTGWASYFCVTPVFDTFLSCSLN